MVDRPRQTGYGEEKMDPAMLGRLKGFENAQSLFFAFHFFFEYGFCH